MIVESFSPTVSSASHFYNHEDSLGVQCQIRSTRVERSTGDSVDLLLANGFPTLRRVGEVRRNQALARQCYLVARQTKQIKPPDGLSVEGLDTRDELIEERRKLVKDLVAILLHDGDSWHVVQIDLRVDKDTKQRLMTFLQKNADVFAWTPVDMLGIDSEVMMHHLKIDLNHHLKK